MRGTTLYLAALLAAGGVLGGTVTASASPSDTGSADPSARAAGGVGGLVWFDRDGDRVRDRGEPGASGVAVRATDLQTGRNYQATTDRGGNYLIRVPAGVYRVSADNTGFRPTTREDQTIRVVNGRAATANYGLQGGSISGLAWYDQNRDGVRQPSESRLSGIPVSATSGNNTIARTTTSRNGTYVLNDVPAGEHQVRFIRPSVSGVGFTEPFVGDRRTDSDVEDVQRGIAFVQLAASSGGVQDARFVDAGYVRD